MAGGCLPNYGREPLPSLRLSFSRFACYHDSYHVFSFATPSARLRSAAGELDQVPAIRRGGPYPASYQRAAPAPGQAIMRRCRGADDCRNPPPDGGAPGRTFAPEMRGYGRGCELGSARPGGKPGHCFRPKTGDIPGLRGALSSYPGIGKASDTKGFRDQSPESPVSPVLFRGMD